MLVGLLSEEYDDIFAEAPAPHLLADDDILNFAELAVQRHRHEDCAEGHHAVLVNAHDVYVAIAAVLHELEVLQEGLLLEGLRLGELRERLEQPLVEVAGLQVAEGHAVFLEEGHLVD